MSNSTATPTAAPSRLRRILIGVGTGLLAIVIGFCAGRWINAPKKVDSASWIFALSYPDANGVNTPLSSIRGEKLTVLNFWATWCPPCVEEMPELSRVHAELEGQGIKTIGLAVDSPSAVAQFAQDKPVSYPLAVIGAAGTSLGERLGNAAGALPYTVLVDADGNVLEQKLGRIHEAELRKWIQKAQKPGN